MYYIIFYSNNFLLQTVLKKYVRNFLEEENWRDRDYDRSSYNGGYRTNRGRGGGGYRGRGRGRGSGTQISRNTAGSYRPRQDYMDYQPEVQQVK